MCVGFVVWPWRLSIKCFRHTIVRLRYKSIFYETVLKSLILRLYNIVRIYFDLNYQAFVLKKESFSFVYSSVDNWICRQLYSWQLRFCWYFDSVSLATIVCLFILLQRVRIARNADRCNSHGKFVCPSFRHILV